MKQWKLIALAALLVWLGRTQDTPGRISYERLDEVVTQLSEITGLPARHPVQYATISRDHLKQFLEQRIQEEVKPEEIRIEELLLKKFGFAPQDFDLRKTTIDLYTEQAAAFYDFHRKKLFLLEGNSSMMEEVALVHELAHALADQHFRLQRFLDRAGKNDDGALARMAVMEGQATWLMAEFMMKKAGQSLLDDPGLVDLMGRMVAASTGQFPVFDSVPPYVRESLVFPYNSGMKFQNAVLKAKGKAGFRAVFQNPPATTREILHPEVYLHPEPAPPAKAPRLKREGPYRTLADGTVGEFDYAVLFNQYIDEDAVRRISPGWRSARYRFLEHKKNGHTVLLQTSCWKDEETARDFQARYREVLQAKWKAFEIAEESPDRLAGTGDDGRFLLWREGARVMSVEGMSGPDERPRATKER